VDYRKPIVFKEMNVLRLKCLVNNLMLRRSLIVFNVSLRGRAVSSGIIIYPVRNNAPLEFLTGFTSMIGYRYPCFFRLIMRMERAAGVTPEILEA